jgi:hypothetical protein
MTSPGYPALLRPGVALSSCVARYLTLFRASHPRRQCLGSSLGSARGIRRCPLASSWISNRSPKCLQVYASVVKPCKNSEHAKCGGRKPLGVRVPPPPLLRYKNLGPVALPGDGAFVFAGVPTGVLLMQAASPNSVRIPSQSATCPLCSRAPTGVIRSSPGAASTMPRWSRHLRGGARSRRQPPLNR